MWAKPRDLFDRDREWAALARFIAGAGAGPMLAVVYGRRRHGKSVLLRQLCEVSGGFYYQAVEGTEIEQLGDLGAAYARHLRFPAAPAFADWDQALEALLALPGDAAPVAIVLDEFPYLTAAAPSLASRIQRALDVRRGCGPASRLVLCGSAMTAMTSLLSGQAPLRGRASTEVAVGPFGFRDAARFVSLDADPQTAIKVHAVCGGVPGYYTLASDVPADGDFDGWMVRSPLSVTRPLLHEARHLLDEESRLRDKAAYLSVLAAMADGCTTSGKIGGRLGRTASAITHTLGALADMQLVVRRDDPTARVAPDLAHRRPAAALLRRGDAPGLGEAGTGSRGRGLAGRAGAVALPSPGATLRGAGAGMDRRSCRPARAWRIEPGRGDGRR
ncbi:MAG: AAA family ATPase [Egibacteraceae bacterium]